MKLSVNFSNSVQDSWIVSLLLLLQIDSFHVNMMCPYSYFGPLQNSFYFPLYSHECQFSPTNLSWWLMMWLMVYLYLFDPLVLNLWISDIVHLKLLSKIKSMSNMNIWWKIFRLEISCISIYWNKSLSTLVIYFSCLKSLFFAGHLWLLSVPLVENANKAFTG